MGTFVIRNTRLVGALVLGMTILAGTAACSGSAGVTATAEHTITVSSSAEVQVVPDKASIGVTVQTGGATPEDAEKAHDAPVNAVIAALKKLGVDETDIQTTYTDLSPIWYADDDDEDAYQMQTRLTVGNLAVEDVATVMDACIAAGATGVDGPDYTTGSYDDAYQEALVVAVEAARPKAEAIAKAGDVTLGSVVNVVEGYQNVTYRDTNVVATEAATDSLMDIEPGQVTISAEVTVTYAIK